jgi:hypothetical protein
VVAQPWREELCLRAMLEVQAAAGYATADRWSGLQPEPRETKEMGAQPVAKL